MLFPSSPPAPPENNTANDSAPQATSGIINDVARPDVENMEGVTQETYPAITNPETECSPESTGPVDVENREIEKTDELTLEERVLQYAEILYRKTREENPDPKKLRKYTRKMLRVAKQIADVKEETS
jgi:hypothetical protein